MHLTRDSFNRSAVASRKQSTRLNLEQLESLALPSAAVPADFPPALSVVESFEGLVAGANNPLSAAEGAFSPGTVSNFTFASGITLTTPIPNPGFGSNGVVVGDWSQGAANLALGTNGAITSAAHVPSGNAYLFVDAVAASAGPVGFTFAKEVDAVGAYVTANGGTNVTLRAYDAAGTLIETTTIAAQARTDWTAKNASTFIGIQNAGIRRVEFSGDFLAMDLLQIRPTNTALVGTWRFAAGADAGGSAIVHQFRPNGSIQYSVDAFPGYGGGVRVAQADFNGDGHLDLVFGTGPGAQAGVIIQDGKTKTNLLSRPIFEGFAGGVFVAAGDVTGDGVPDLVVTPDQGGGPRVVILRGGDFQTIASFFGIDDPDFRGGARAAVGDMNGDGRADLVVSAGFGGGPRVAAFNGMTLTTTRAKLFDDMFVFEPELRNGAFVAVGDVDGDGKGDLIAGAGPGGAPRVLILSGADLVNNKANSSKSLASFFAGDPNNRSGIRVSAKNLDGDIKADVVTGDGAGNGSRLTSYLGRTFTNGSAPAALSLNAFPGFSGGIFVG